jgi:hypothetical protein
VFFLSPNANSNRPDSNFPWPDALKKNGLPEERPF